MTAGAWTRSSSPVLPSLLRPTRQKVLYFRPAEAAAFEPGRFPVFIYKGADALDDFYGMPAFLGMGVKAARHGGPETDPDLERTVGTNRIARRSALSSRMSPGLAEAPIDRTETCLYTVSPDEHFRLDFPPGRRTSSSPARAAATASSSRAWSARSWPTLLPSAQPANPLISGLPTPHKPPDIPGFQQNPAQCYKIPSYGRVNLCLTLI